MSVIKKPRKAVYKPSVAEEVQRLQYNIITHSIIYYYMNDSIVSDDTFDRWCSRIVDLKEHESFIDSKFYEDFKDFDGTTGMHIAGKYRDNRYMQGLCLYLLRINDSSLS